jgi:hypothetical protein
MLYESGPAKQMTQRCEPRLAKSSGAQALGLAQVSFISGRMAKAASGFPWTFIWRGSCPGLKFDAIESLAPNITSCS